MEANSAPQHESAAARLSGDENPPSSVWHMRRSKAPKNAGQIGVEHSNINDTRTEGCEVYDLGPKNTGERKGHFEQPAPQSTQRFSKMTVCYPAPRPGETGGFF